MLSISYILLQQYWWALISILAGLLVFLLFVQGGQSFIFSLGKTSTQRALLVNSMGRKWEFTFTTLVTFGGAFFASFPMFYTASFGGAYWVWMVILFSFIIQAVSFEYRSKPNNIYGSKFFEVLLFLNGTIAPLFLGTAVATFFTGSAFSVSLKNISGIGTSNAIASWENPLHGLEAITDWRNLMLGFAVLFLSRVLGLLYILNNVRESEIEKSARKKLWINASIFVVFFLAFVGAILLGKGYAYKPDTGEVFLQQYKYLLNFVEMPAVGLIFLVGVVLVLAGIILSLLKTTTKGIWYAGPGTILTVVALFMCAGYNNTSFYPSTFNIQHSLTIENSSSSFYTLSAMSYVSLLIPFVAAYIFYAWRAINNKKIDADELESGQSHVY
jgi:cytochrome bd ubiquinol oxidase subunit II